MYCYTIVNSLDCVLKELGIWTQISSEHHIFLLKIAQLTNKRINRSLEKRIKDSRKEFTKLEKSIVKIDKQFNGRYNAISAKKKTKAVIDLLKEFLQLDKNFLGILKNLEKIGKRDKVWQALIAHIIDEQEYMFSLFSNLLNQLET